MRNSLKWKMRFVFGILAVVILLQGLLSLIFIVRIDNETKRLIEHQNMVEEIGTIVSSHYSWLSGFTLSAFTDEEFSGSLDYRTCSLGQWLQDERITGVDDRVFLELLQKVQAPHQAIHENAAGLMQRRTQGNISQREIEQVFQETRPLSLETISYLEELQRHEDVQINAIQDGITRYVRMVQVLVAIIVLVSVAIAVVAMILLIRNVVPPLVKITQVAERLSKGDASADVDIHVTSRDEIGRLVTAFNEMIRSERDQVAITEAVADGDLTRTIAPRCQNDGMGIALGRMVEKLNRMFGEIRDAADQVSSGAGEISSGAQLLAQGATEQSSNTDTFVSTIDQVAGNSQDNLEIAHKAAALGNEIREKAQSGSAQMERLTQAVSEINQASASIEKVIKVIEDIAFQTNILALNAAVEAARAGQHGKGFAVVADEVRNLAQKSAEAAKDSTDLITASIQKAAVGMEIAGQTSQSLTEITAGIEDNDRIVAQIAAASAQQTDSIHELGENITQIATVVQQNSATSEEAAAASEQLAAQAHLLKSLLAQFKLQGETGPAAAAPSTAGIDTTLKYEETGFSF